VGYGQGQPRMSARCPYREDTPVVGLRSAEPIPGDETHYGECRQTQEGSVAQQREDRPGFDKQYREDAKNQ